MSECLGTLRRSSRGLSRGSSLTTSPPPRVRVPRHVARLVTRLVARLVVNYFASAARPIALARCAVRRVARRRLLRLHRASGCLGTSRGSSHGSSTTSPTPRVRVPRYIARLVTRLVVNHFTFVARPVGSARCAARRVARRRLLCLRRASGCLGTSRGSSHGSSSTTSSPSRVRVPRHVAWLAVDYFAYAARPGASIRRAARHTALHRLLRAPRLRLAATLALLQPHRAS
jgi:hypothetical protein